jgi:hypothetical protein
VDIVTIAKGIASGMPLGVTAARADVMTWPPGAHASTFGGNPSAPLPRWPRSSSEGRPRANAEVVATTCMAGCAA